MKRPLFFAAILGLALAGIICATAFILRSYSSIVVHKTQPVHKPSLKTTPTPTPDPYRPYSIALLGYGGGTHDGGRLTDSIIVARIFPRLQKIILISVPRDLWVNLPLNGDDTVGYKINAAYAIGSDDRKYPHKKPEFTGPAGGGEMAKYILGQVLGFDIDYFVALDFRGFVKIIDNLGGVDVRVERTLDDPLYPIEGMESDLCGKTIEEITALEATLSGQKLEEAFTCRYENLHFDKGLVHMDGKTALKYVRSRHAVNDGGDFNRSQRQRNLLLAVKQKIMNFNLLYKIIPIINTLSQNLQTDIDLSRLQQFITDAPELSNYQITNVALTDQNVLEQGRSPDRQMILLPKSGLDNYTEIYHFVESTLEK